MARNLKGFRIERDTLGEKPVPEDALYGIQTQRAVENFPISGLRPKPEFIVSTAMVKKASCLANMELGLLDAKRGRAVIKAAEEIISGEHHDQFMVDVYQAGAGTSHNMNANEVIANRANVLLGGRPGEYRPVHPNDHVNMSQSTNDTMPTALRVAALMKTQGLLRELKALEAALNRKSKEFDRIVKSGRTHLQDAVPVRLGQEFGSYAASVRTSIGNMNASSGLLKRVALGGTAVGTGINTHPRYRDMSVKALSRISGYKLKKAPDPFEAQMSSQDFSAFSSSLKNLSLELIRISNDLRLLSSGPRTGLAEITLPAVQPGSSIMPGKINPVVAEMLNMVSFQVTGHDLTVTLAAQAGQFELNVMLPVINYNILQSLEILTSAIHAFTTRCVEGIKADKKRCRHYFENSVGLATVLNRFIGYERAAVVAKEAASTGKTVREIVLEKGILTEEELDRLLDPSAVTEPADIKKLKGR